MSELKIKLGVDLSGVDDAAAQIPEKIERAARKQRRPLRPVRVWNERAGKWEAGLDPQNPNVPGGPSNRRAPTPNAYPSPIGPMPSGIPSGPFVPSARAYNRPIGPGLPGMPGGVLYTGSDKWARTFTDNLLGALEKSVMRMVVPVHIFNRFTNFIISGVMEMFDRASRIYSVSRASGMSPENIQRLAYAAKMSGVEVDTLYNILESGNIKLGNAILKGGEVAVALQRIGIQFNQLRDRTVGTKEVLMRLADLYQDVNQRALAASVGYSIFGDEFKKLIPLISRGSAEVKRIGESANVMSDSTVQAMENTKRLFSSFWDWVLVTLAHTVDFVAGMTARQREKFHTGVVGMGGWDMNEHEKEVTGVEKMSMKEKLDVLSMTEGEAKAKNRYLIPYATRMDAESLEQWRGRMTSFLIDKIANSRSAELRDYSKQLLEALPGYVAERTAQPGLLTGQLPFASSLQSMGGGDILSAISANPMDEIARNTAATAANTERIANKETAPGSPKPTAILTK